MQSIEKPILLLDVDGVLMTINEQRPLGAKRRYQDDYFQFYYPRHGRWLRSLEARTEPWWMTSVQHPNEVIGSLLGLQEIPRIPKQRYHGRGCDERTVAAEKLFSEESIIWFDDEHAPYGRFEWAEERNDRGLPTLLIEPDSEIGIERYHIIEAHHWIGNLATRAI